jgi:hypothetical protein
MGWKKKDRILAALSLSFITPNKLIDCGLLTRASITLVVAYVRMINLTIAFDKNVPTFVPGVIQQ